MARRRQGTIEERNGRFYVKLTVALDNGKTGRRKVPKGGLSTRESAEALRDRLAAKTEGRVFAAKTSPTISVHDYVETIWLPSRERRGIKTVRKDRERLRAHVLPIIGRLSMQDVTADDLRDVVESLDAKIQDHSLKFGWKTARHCWMTCKQVFSDAVMSKQAALRVLAVNSAASVKGPDRGVVKELQWLYPVEFDRLMRSDVPLRWRRIYAVATLLFLRWGEVRALAWRDLDLNAGMAYIHEQLDDETGEICPTKTKDVRHVPIELTLLPMLGAMRAEDPSAVRLFSSVDKPASTLREHLLHAGVARSSLHRETETSLPIRFHDLRATGITWMAIRGDPSIQMQRRAGHLTLAMTDLYTRKAGIVGAGVGEPFPELPPELVSSPGIVPRNIKRAKKPVRRGGLEPLNDAPNGGASSRLPEHSATEPRDSGEQGTFQGTILDDGDGSPSLAVCTLAGVAGALRDKKPGAWAGSGLDRIDFPADEASP